jgi:hypothetical protein
VLNNPAYRLIKAESADQTLLALLVIAQFCLAIWNPLVNAIRVFASDVLPAGL